MTASGSGSSHPATDVLHTPKPTAATNHTAKRPCSRQEVARLATANTAEAARSQLSNACVAAKNGSTDTSTGVTRQWTGADCRQRADPRGVGACARERALAGHILPSRSRVHPCLSPVEHPSPPTYLGGA